MKQDMESPRQANHGTHCRGRVPFLSDVLHHQFWHLAVIVGYAMEISLSRNDVTTEN